ncbi:hypothetical protein ETD86_45825 [Nonomuraea turkmeniaca]|uniref:Uncharacterized protein n=1 Tax=Nonomuraea turkmeniaca TaxID=103838 RepID=A0A5S4EZD9_9ACTN|nr:hypothetical protein [Nonomuraea turkmeniaca]TMR08895.1 hypothetical protein ETD86_45825 [Nonomuraea turkmeniaca]
MNTQATVIIWGGVAMHAEASGGDWAGALRTVRQEQQAQAQLQNPTGFTPTLRTYMDHIAEQARHRFLQETSHLDT